MERIYHQIKCVSEHICIIVKKYPLFSGILELNILCFQYIRAYDENKLDLLPSLISQIEPMINPYVKNVIQRYDNSIKLIEEKCMLYKTRLYNSEHYKIYLRKIDPYHCAIHKYKDHKDLTALIEMDNAVKYIERIFDVPWIEPRRVFDN